MTRAGGLIIGALLLIGVASAAINLTAESGKTWIKWSWDAGKNVTVTIDGTTNTTGITSGVVYIYPTLTTEFMFPSYLSAFSLAFVILIAKVGRII